MTDDQPSVAALINPEKEGYLVKQGGLIRSWKKRWFVLKGTTIYYFKTRADSEPAGVIPLDETTQVLDGEAKTGRKDSMELVTTDRSFLIYSDQPVGAKREIEEWKEAIERAITGSNQLRQSGALNKPIGRTVELVIRGMMCECCEKKVRSTISKIRGVLEVDINLEEEKVKVTANKLDINDLINALEDAGFLPAVL